MEGRRRNGLPVRCANSVFDEYLKDRKPAEPMAQAMIYNPSENRWDKFADWPSVDEKHLTPMYLEAKFGLGLERPAGGEDEYLSAPAKPVPFWRRL